MPATDLERLIIQLEASDAKLTKSLDKIAGNVDNKLGAVEKRASVMSDRVNAAFSKAGQALAAYFSIREVAAFIGRITDAADKLQALSNRTGVGVDQLQKLAGAAAKTNISTQELNEALDLFGRNLGRASEGQGELAQVMRDHGIAAGQDLISTLMSVAAAVQNAKTRTEEYRITTAAFGRSSEELVGFLRQGPALIKAQMDAFKDGLTPQAVKDLAEFAQSWKEIEVSFTNMAAGPASAVLRGLTDFLHDLEHGNWQQRLAAISSLLTLGFVGFNPDTGTPGAAGAAGAKPKPFGGANEGNADAARREIARTLSERQAAEAALARATGEANAESLRDTTAYFDAVRQEIRLTADAAILAADAKAKAEIAALDEMKLGAKAFAEAKANIEQTAAFDETAIQEKRRGDIARSNVEELQQARAASEALASIQDQRTQTLQRTATGAAGANRDLIRAADDAAIELARGTGAYFGTVKLAIEDELRAAKEVISEQEQLEIDSLAKLREQRFKAGEDGVTVWKDYEEAVRNVHNKANDEAAAADERARLQRHQIKEEETRDLQRQIEVMDSVRGGLEDIGVAALDGSKSFKQAVSDMLKQIAILILRLYVLKPLIELVLGRAGTTGGFNILSLFGLGGGGGGALATGFSDLPVYAAQGAVVGPHGRMPLKRYARGGIARSPQMALFGEGSNPEAYIPLAGGHVPVTLRVPRLPNSGRYGPPQVTQSFMIDARGAQEGVAEQIRDALQKAAPQIVGTSVQIVEKNFGRMYRRTWRREL